MDRLSQRLDQLTPLQRAVFALKESQAKLESLERARNEPIAIVGMACRLPGGADSPDAFWDLLRRGGDAIREVPAERWNVDDYYDPDPMAPGKTNSRWGGFLDRIDAFDRQFFGVSEREASRMDPQQRLVLELAWEALEDAGLPPGRLAGSRTGVFLGIAGSDYCLFQVGDPFRSDAYASTGTAICIAANRVSFTFDFRGPSLALDTACSSSLVAVHQACQSLRRGESTVALAGGVNIMLCPTTVVSLTKAGLSSPDGRCRSFDARAEGYVRSEGGGLVVLKPLSKAMADGDPIHAVIRASTVNQDGLSNGMKTPNRQAQEALLREAYAQAGINPRDVAYVETQGTGTLMGDMIEARALGNVLSLDRPSDSPCLIGSVKTNIGHLETASGIAGLIKTALILEHRAIPGNLHFQTPNPHIPFDELRLKVVNGPTPLPTGSSRGIAGVSALGFGGTNAHVVLEEAPSQAAEIAAPTEEGAVILPLSAHQDRALVHLSQRVREALAPPSAPALKDAAFTLGGGRDHHDHRLAIVARTHDDVLNALDAFIRCESNPRIFAGRKPHDRRPRAAFFFSSELTDWRQAIEGIHAEEPVFRSVLDECAQTIESIAGWSLFALIEAPPHDARWNDPAFASPALTAFQIGLATLWKSWGIQPVAVVGVGAGEASAAWSAGVLTLHDALRVSLHHGRSSAGSTQTADGLLEGIDARRCTLPLVSPIDGQDLDGTRLTTSYWSDRSTTGSGGRSAAALVNLKGRRPDAVLVIGSPAHGAEAIEGPVIASLDPGFQGRDSLLPAVAALYASGHPVDWVRLNAGKGRHVSFPGYPWQRERCWLEGDLSGLGISTAQPAPSRPAPNDAPGLANVDPGAEGWYEIRWEEQPLPQSPGPVTGESGRWLVLADSSGVGERLSELLEERGHEVTIVSNSWTDPVAATVEAFREGQPGWSGIVHCWSLDVAEDDATRGAAIDSSQRLGCGPALALVQALVRSAGGDVGARLWLVTRGAQAVNGSSPDVVATAPAQAPIWGLGRTLAQEHPRHWGGLIDLDPAGAIDELARSLRDELLVSDGEDQIAWRAGRRHAARLVSRSRPSRTSGAFRFRADATYLVTGGLGGLGRAVSRWMVEQGARRLILVGRTPLPPRLVWAAVDPETPLGKKIAAVRSLEALGASVHLAAVDVSDEEALGAFVRTFRAERWPSIRGVFHLAGTSDFTPLADLDPDRLSSVLRPKLAGGWQLHELLSDQPLDAFVLFSSAVSVLGSPLLGAFAAGNAALDALAAHRRAKGLPATVINWGAWSASSVDEAPATGAGKNTIRRGIHEFSKEHALAILGRVLDETPAQVVTMPYSADDWADRPPIPLSAPILKRLELRRSAARPVQPRPELTTPYQPPRTDLERWLAALWSEILRIDPVGIGDNFFELGGDSLQGAMILNRLQAEFQEILHLLAMFETPTIEGLSAYLRRTYRADIRRIWPGEELGPDVGSEVPSDRPEVIGPGEMETVRRMIAPAVRRLSESWTLGPKNPRAVFVLSPPRSGSTLLRVMLAGHPALFVPQELYLLQYNTLADRERSYQGPTAYYLDGGIGALMEAKGLDLTTAKEAMRGMEQAGMTTQEFYRLLQQSIGGRILVDKTPAYGVGLEILERAEAMFEEPVYIHLARHPCGMIRSYEEYHLAEVVLANVEHPFSPMQVGEMVWINQNENILKFLEGVPDDRQLRIRFEDLVNHPEEILRAVCRVLGLDYHPSMARPYDEPERRMVDGLLPESRMLGDQKFILKHRAIDPSVADRWKQDMTGDFLGPPARELALRLGYDDIAPPGKPRVDRIERASSGEAETPVIENLDALSDDEVEALLRDELTNAEARHE